MSGSAGYDSTESTSSKIRGRVELDAALAFGAPPRHLGVIVGCHCVWELVKSFRSCAGAQTAT